MKGNKRKLKKLSFRILVILLIPVILIIIGIYSCESRKHVNTEESKSEPTELKIINDERYQVKIDYQKTNVSDVDAKAEKYIVNMEKEFYKKASKVGSLIEDLTFDLIVNSRQVNYKDILFVQITSFEYTGGAHYEQEDINFVYEKSEKKFLTFEDFLVKKECLQKLSEIAEQEIVQFFENHGNTTYLKDLIYEGTKPIAENYQYFSLSESGLKLIFPPYTVGSRSDGQVEIMIPYSKLKGIIKEKYLGEEKKQSEPPKQKSRDLSSYAGKKLIAFTFDDGPNNATTISLVDRIQKYDARVTFFVLGSRIQTHSEAIKYAYEKGNQIGSHTFNHLNLAKLPESQLRSEIENTDAEIERILGIKPSVIRPPYGSNNEYVKKSVGRPIIQWDVDTLDWKHRDSDRIAQEILNHASDGGIVLMHDIYQTSVDGCLKAMDMLYKDGYVFVTIDELSRMKSVNLENGKAYFHLG